MGKSRTNRPAPKANRPLAVQLDTDSQAALVRAAELRGLSVSDYIRVVAVAQARREVEAAASRTIVMTPEEQLAFWNALNRPVELTPAQQELGKLIRGES